MSMFLPRSLLTYKTCPSTWTINHYDYNFITLFTFLKCNQWNSCELAKSWTFLPRRIILCAAYALDIQWWHRKLLQWKNFVWFFFCNFEQCGRHSLVITPCLVLSFDLLKHWFCSGYIIISYNEVGLKSGSGCCICISRCLLHNILDMRFGYAVDPLMKSC